MPIFVGGTGRSGTSVTGRLLDAHPAITATAPLEIRFLTDKDGLLDLAFIADTYRTGVRSASSRTRLRHRVDRLRGTRVDPIEERFEPFLARMRDSWYLWHGEDDGLCRGLHQGMTRAFLDEALATFRRDFVDDPLASSAGLVRALLDPQAERRSATAWVDTTPHNSLRAQRIADLMPDARHIHLIRDGRDVAASVLRMVWGPKTPADALEWWRWRVLHAHRAFTDIGPERAHEVVFERLVATDRDATLEGLLAFLGHEVTPSVRDYFERHMPVERGHVARWRQDFDADARAEFERTYARMHAELADEGVPLPPL